MSTDARGLRRAQAALFRERVDVIEGKIYVHIAAKWSLELLRIGTRQTTAVLRLNHQVVARVNGDTTRLHLVQLRLMEVPR
jgi:hypothetical protein